MIKKHKDFSSPYPSQLPDVNEQELAKVFCTDTKRILSSKAGRDSSDKIGESLPENILNGANNQESNANSLPPREKYPQITSGEQPSGNEQKSPPSTDTKNSECRGGKIYGAIIVLCLLTGAIAVFLSAALGSSQPTPLPSDSGESGERSESTAPPNSTEFLTDVTNVADIYKSGLASTVTVASETNGKTDFYSGFCLFDGFVATVSEATLGDTVRVILSDGSSYPCSVRSSIAEIGLALLQTDAALDTVSVGNYSALRAGDGAYAIAGVGGERCDLSLLCGIVLNTSQSVSIRGSDGIRRLATVLQIGCICDRNIGGSPIFDSDGELIAMAISTDEQESGTCLAIPLDALLPVFRCMYDGELPSNEVMAAVAYTPASLGILGICAEQNGLSGVEVRGFTLDGSDAALMLRVGDLIYKINDAPVSGTDELAEQLENHFPSDTVEIFLLRGSQRLSFKVKLCYF